MEEQTCSECGAILEKGKSCRDYFNEMLAWDFEDFTGAGTDHHLTVLCYNLEHPSVYSTKGLEDAKYFLKEIIENNLSRDDMYERNKKMLASDNRDWKIAGSSNDHGSYPKKMIWSMTALDVVKRGVKEYPKTIKEWAKAVYDDLKI